jgi:hypothetical protein
VEDDNRVVISDAGAGQLKISGAHSGDDTVDATTQIVLKSYDGASQDAYVQVTATASTVNLTFDTLTLRSSHGSPLDLKGGDSGTDGSTVVVTLVGDKNSCVSSKGNRAGISVPKGSSLTIQGTGALYAEGDDCAAGIGGNENAASGSITISGGTVTAKSNDGWVDGAGAAIGGGRKASNAGGITISGGTVKATGGKYGCGIGGGDSGAAGDITITGGTVTATGGKESAGIGSGNESSSAAGSISISGGTVTASCAGDYGEGIGGGDQVAAPSITISSGAQVTATGGSGAAGIGSGSKAKASNGTITISGGIVKAMTSSNSASAAIGGAARKAESWGDGDVAIVISGGTVTATASASGCGIGGAQSCDVKSITISGGDITATGGQYAAAIGSGGNSTVRDLTISGGEVHATGGEKGAGIGSGAPTGRSVDHSKATITITGGTVEAYGSTSTTPGIGCVGSSSKTAGVTTTITGGSVLSTGSGADQDAEIINPAPKDASGTAVYRRVVALDQVADDASLEGATLAKAAGATITYGTNDMQTLNSALHMRDGRACGTLYLYLPHDSGDTTDLGSVTATSGATYLKTAVATGTDGFFYGKATYTVRFDGNGATSGTMADETLDWGVAKALTRNAFTRPGYTFLGWSKTKAATKADYADAQSVTDVAGATVTDGPGDPLRRLGQALRCPHLLQPVGRHCGLLLADLREGRGGCHGRHGEGVDRHGGDRPPPRRLDGLRLHHVRLHQCHDHGHRGGLRGTCPRPLHERGPRGQLRGQRLHGRLRRQRARRCHRHGRHGRRDGLFVRLVQGPHEERLHVCRLYLLRLEHPVGRPGRDLRRRPVGHGPHGRGRWYRHPPRPVDEGPHLCDPHLRPRRCGQGLVLAGLRVAPGGH